MLGCMQPLGTAVLAKDKPLLSRAGFMRQHLFAWAQRAAGVSMQH